MWCQNGKEGKDWSIYLCLFKSSALFDQIFCFRIILQVAFPLLQYLSVSECKSLKYLLSCSAATRLSELMHLKLDRCDGIEEIIFVTENTTISFPKLQSVELSRLRNLKRMSSSNSCIVEYPCLEKLTIKASLPDAQPQANETVN